MKLKAFWVATCSVIIFVFCTTSFSFAGPKLWPLKSGELCWAVYQPPSPVDPEYPPDEDSLPPWHGLLKLYVFQTGKNHYLVNGSSKETNDEPLVNGSAILKDDSITIHASSSGFDDDEVRGLIGTIKLDGDTLNGIFQGIGIRWDKKDTPPSGHFTYDDEQVLIHLSSCPAEND